VGTARILGSEVIIAVTCPLERLRADTQEEGFASVFAGRRRSRADHPRAAAARMDDAPDLLYPPPRRAHLGVRFRPSARVVEEGYRATIAALDRRRNGRPSDVGVHPLRPSPSACSASAVSVAGVSGAGATGMFVLDAQGKAVSRGRTRSGRPSTASSSGTAPPHGIGA